METYEVWWYPIKSQEDRAKKIIGMFTGYINSFLRIKQQADDWPSWAKTDEQKDQYIKEYEAKEGKYFLFLKNLIY
jgi:hypothetical protein